MTLEHTKRRIQEFVHTAVYNYSGGERVNHSFPLFGRGAAPIKPPPRIPGIRIICLIFRSDIEKVGKEMKGVSTEIKYIDSNMKKDSANVKLEQTGFR